MSNDSPAVRASGEPQELVSDEEIEHMKRDSHFDPLRERLRAQAYTLRTIADRINSYLSSPAQCSVEAASKYQGEIRASASPSDDGARQPQLDLEPIKERLAAAYEGPWIVAGQDREDGERWVVFAGGRGEDSSLLQEADAEFIAHARQDIPALLAEIERLRAAASDDGAARPQPAQEPKGYDRPSPCYSDEYYLAMAALDQYPVTDDGLGKSTSVIFRIHQLGHELQRIAALSSSSVAQGWTALDGFTLDRIEQTLKTIGAITQDDAHWLISKLTKAVTPSTPAGAAQTKNETS